MADPQQHSDWKGSEDARKDRPTIRDGGKDCLFFSNLSRSAEIRSSRAALSQSIVDPMVSGSGIHARRNHACKVMSSITMSVFSKVSASSKYSITKYKKTRERVGSPGSAAANSLIKVALKRDEHQFLSAIAYC